MQRGRNGRAGKDRAIQEAYFHVRRGLEADLFSVNEWLRIEGCGPGANDPGRSDCKTVTRELADEGFHTHGTQELQEAGKTNRRNPVDAEHVDGHYVVAE